MRITYKWILGRWASADTIAACSSLYSAHYGFWSGTEGARAGKRIRQNPAQVKALLESPDARLALAYADAELVGYAIAVQTKSEGYGVVSWVTQLVVHEDHRKRDIAKRLLFSIWSFSTHKAWGLVTANPYAVRALEKATRRRCKPARILRAKDRLFAIGKEHVSYIKRAPDVDSRRSVIDTEFPVDHSGLRAMLASVVTKDVPWTLGELADGFEWFAFTFDDQDPLSLTRSEVDAMLQVSDEVVKCAYARMNLTSPSHKWTTHTQHEVAFVIDELGIHSGDSVLDVHPRRAPKSAEGRRVKLRAPRSSPWSPSSRCARFSRPTGPGLGISATRRRSGRGSRRT